MTPLEIRRTIEKAGELLVSVRFPAANDPLTKNEALDIKHAATDVIGQAREIFNSAVERLQQISAEYSGRGWDESSIYLGLYPELDERVEKRGNRWCTVHCHGAKKGQVIACFDTKEKAMAQHRAIEMSKHMGESEKGWVPVYSTKDLSIGVAVEAGNEITVIGTVGKINGALVTVYTKQGTEFEFPIDEIHYKFLDGIPDTFDVGESSVEKAIDQLVEMQGDTPEHPWIVGKMSFEDLEAGDTTVLTVVEREHSLQRIAIVGSGNPAGNAEYGPVRSEVFIKRDTFGNSGYVDMGKWIIVGYGPATVETLAKYKVSKNRLYFFD